MVVEHLKASNNQCPTGWDDLRDGNATCVERAGSSWSFEEFSTRTRVDWQAVTDNLLATSAGQEKPNSRVIPLADGTESHWQSSDPNQIVFDHLRSTQSAE